MDLSDVSSSDEEGTGLFLRFLMLRVDLVILRDALGGHEEVPSSEQDRDRLALMSALLALGLPMLSCVVK